MVTNKNSFFDMNTIRVKTYQPRNLGYNKFHGTKTSMTRMSRGNIIISKIICTTLLFGTKFVFFVNVAFWVI